MELIILLTVVWSTLAIITILVAAVLRDLQSAESLLVRLVWVISARAQQLVSMALRRDSLPTVRLLHAPKPGESGRGRGRGTCGNAVRSHQRSTNLDD